jgi:hypothetical protein
MAITPNDLIDVDTGEVNLSVLKSLARRRAMQDYGSLSPRAVRQALRYFGGMIPERQAAWRQRNGLPVASSTITSFAKEIDGVRRSAF